MSAWENNFELVWPLQRPVEIHEKVVRTIYFQNPDPDAVPERPPGSVRRLAGSSSYVLELVFPLKFRFFLWKTIILGTSDVWSTSCLSHRPSKLAYYTVDWRISINIHEHLIFKIPTQLLFQKGRPVLFAGSSSYVLELVFPRGLSTFRCLMITIFRILLDFFFGPYVSRLLEVQCKYS